MWRRWVPSAVFLRTENSAGQKVSVGLVPVKLSGREAILSLNTRLSRDDVDRGPSDRRELLAHARSGRARITVGAVNDRLLFAPTHQSNRARAGRSVAWKGRATVALASRAS